MRLLHWLADHEGTSLTTAADALGIALVDIERLANELVDAGMIERSAVH
jgi:DNA-binding IclR family transcriptional regulator